MFSNITGIVIIITYLVNFIYTDGVYTITVGYTTYMQNLSFELKFELCVMHLMMRVYTLSVYRRLILSIISNVIINVILI